VSSSGHPSEGHPVSLCVPLCTTLLSCALAQGKIFLTTSGSRRQHAAPPVLDSTVQLEQSVSLPAAGPLASYAKSTDLYPGDSSCTTTVSNQKKTPTKKSKHPCLPASYPPAHSFLLPNLGCPSCLFHLNAAALAVACSLLPFSAGRDW